MTDLEFVQKCVKGDKQTWDEFVDKYSRLIYNYIHSVLKIKGLSTISQDSIDDLSQEIFYSLIKDNFKKLKSFKAKNGCSLASWLRQVVIHSTIDYLRRLKPTLSMAEENEDGLSLEDTLTDNSASVVEVFAQKEKFKHLKDCIGKLDRDDKYFLELHMNIGLGPEELKDVFKISRPAIDMRKSRIIERLRECFRRKGFALDF